MRKVWAPCAPPAIFFFEVVRFRTEQHPRAPAQGITGAVAGAAGAARGALGAGALAPGATAADEAFEPFDDLQASLGRRVGWFDVSGSPLSHSMPFRPFPCTRAPA
jgi:hypothetical protein